MEQVTTKESHSEDLWALFKNKFVNDEHWSSGDGW